LRRTFLKQETLPELKHFIVLASHYLR